MPNHHHSGMANNMRHVFSAKRSQYILRIKNNKWANVADIRSILSIIHPLFHWYCFTNYEAKTTKIEITINISFCIPSKNVCVKVRVLLQ